MVPSKSATPILDLELPLPGGRKAATRRRRLKEVLIQIVLVLVLFPVGIIVLFGLIKLFGQSSVEVPTYFFLPLLGIALFPVVAIHELGHITAGLIVGLQFKRLVVGPLMITASPQGLKFSLYRDFSFGGLTGMGIRRLGRLRSKLAIQVAGGPFASLISGLVGAVVIRYGLIGSINFIVQAVEVFVVMSIFAGLLNLAPFWLRNGLASDGKKLLWLLTSKEKTCRWIYILALQMQLDSGVRPKDMKSTWIARACAVRDESPFELSVLWIAYVAAQDQEQTEQAAQRLEACLQQFAVASPQYRNLLLMEAAIFQAWNRENLEKADIWHARACESGRSDPLNLTRLDISMNWARRRYDEALSAWQKGFDQIERLPASASKDLSRQSWLGWKEEMEKRLGKRESLITVI